MSGSTRFWAATAGVLVVIATACGRGSDQEATPPSESVAPTTASPTAAPTTGSPAPAAGPQITIEGFRYGGQLTVPPGSQVTVVNKDSAEHSVTSDDPAAFDTDVAGNAQATFTAPTQPGSYPFHCTYHRSMQATLNVQ